MYNQPDQNKGKMPTDKTKQDFSGDTNRDDIRKDRQAGGYDKDVQKAPGVRIDEPGSQGQWKAPSR
jgi:hypothetical protein